MLEYSIAATPSFAPCCPKPVFLAGRSGSPMALSPSRSWAVGRQEQSPAKPFLCSGGCSPLWWEQLREQEQPLGSRERDEGPCR